MNQLKAAGAVAAGACATGAVAAVAVAVGAVAGGAVAGGAVAAGAVASGACATGACATGAVAAGAVVGGAVGAAGQDTMTRPHSALHAWLAQLNNHLLDSPKNSWLPISAIQGSQKCRCNLGAGSVKYY